MLLMKAAFISLSLLAIQSSAWVRGFSGSSSLASSSSFRTRERRSQIQHLHGPRSCSSQVRMQLQPSERKPVVESSLEPLSTNEEEVLPAAPAESTNSRRSVLASLVTAATASTSLTAFSQETNAYYDKSYPDELNASDETIDSRQRQRYKVLNKQQRKTKPPLDRLLGAILWGTALWFGSGSRSNPLVTPMANLLYSDNDDDNNNNNNNNDTNTNKTWLQDRNEGLFANVPLPLYIVLAILFGVFGWGVDTLISALASQDASSSLQLAGVSLIAAAALELGRIASGEKQLTRTEMDRTVQLREEFDEFCQSRLIPGGNCHRTDVIRAFRRYYAKYRQESAELTDLEIEQLLREWSRPLPGVTMSSAGFYTGIQINEQADVFAPSSR